MSDGFDYTRFDIPVSKDEQGIIHTEPILVQDKLIPAMAQIIKAATGLRSLRSQYIYSLRGTDPTLGESILRQLRDRIRFDLEQGMRAEALKMQTTIITPIEYEEHGTATDGEVLFVAKAVGMTLIEFTL